MEPYQQDEESHSLLNNSAPVRVDVENKKPISNGLIKVLAIAVGVLVVFLMVSDSFSASGDDKKVQTTLNDIKPSVPKLPLATASKYEIKVRVKTNDYDELKSLENLPWDAVAEPFKKNKASLRTFEVEGKSYNLKTLGSAISLNWVIDGVTYENTNEVEFQIDRTGVVPCKLTIVVNTDVDSTVRAGAEYSYDFKMASKYVRREIRTLKDADRQAFFAALKQVYTVEESVGKALYGDKFNTAEHFLVKHLEGAATSDCDHWHDGAGIVTHHVAITLAMEQSLQAINPAVAMPYWEYGMDPYLYSTFQESPVFGANWYGEASPSNPEHKISDKGLWDGVAMPSGQKYLEWDISKTGSLRPYVNAYGQLRSPWNNNPSTYIGRTNTVYGRSTYTTAPSCSLFQSCFQNTELSSIFSCLNGRTHGPVHIMIGGAWNEGDTLDDVHVKIFQNPDKLLLFKVLWRMGLTRCPEQCNVGDECKCAVPEEYLKTYGAKGILEMSGIYQAFSSQLSSASNDVLLLVIKALEDPGIVGEMYSSAASYDPTFWPLHGAAERLVSLKRALVSDGTITDFDESWNYPSFTTQTLSSGAYLDGVCDWSKVKGVSDLTLPTCTSGSWCSGHYKDDVIEFGNFLGKGETYTNGEMYAFMHPWNDDLPYTYDTFDYDYCAENGYDFFDNLNTNNNKAPPKGVKTNVGQTFQSGERSGM